MDLQRLTVLSLTILAVTGTPSVLAQPLAIPQPDRNGNYLRNDTPFTGTAPSPLMRGSLWQVVSSGLNCRSGFGLRYGVTRQFNRGALLQAEVGRGGSDEVLVNPKDEKGQPWMPARSPQGQNYNCYVRANHRYIQPYQRKRTTQFRRAILIKMNATTRAH
jgi:hypothetical protein